MCDVERRRRDSNPRPMCVDYALATRCIRRSATPPNLFYRYAIGRRDLSASGQQFADRYAQCCCDGVQLLQIQRPASGFDVGDARLHDTQYAR